MIEGIVSKIIVGGIKNFSKEYNATDETTQIRVYFDDKLQVKYDACVDWQPKEDVPFKKVLNKKLDLLGYEAMSTPIFQKALLGFSEKFEIEYSDVSVFLFLKNEIIGLCVFNSTDHVHTVSLSEHLPSLLMD